jgi:hypothetical protein
MNRVEVSIGKCIHAKVCVSEGTPVRDPVESCRRFEATAPPWNHGPLPVRCDLEVKIPLYMDPDYIKFCNRKLRTEQELRNVVSCIEERSNWTQQPQAKRESIGPLDSKVR